MEILNLPMWRGQSNSYCENLQFPKFGATGKMNPIRVSIPTCTPRACDLEIIQYLVSAES